MVNYMRVLNKARCGSCGYIGYDADFENYDFTIIEEFTSANASGISQEVNIKIVCPKCKKENTMKLLDIDDNRR